MLKKKASRLAVVVLTAGSAAALFAGIPSATSAAPQSTLFAITRNQQLLVKVDPATGALTQVTGLFPNCSGNCPVDSQSFDLASDPTTHRLYAERFESFSFNPPPVFQEELLTIDSQTGAILSHPQFTSQPPGELAFDTSSHALFGFTGTEIVKVDPATATVTPFAAVGTPFQQGPEDMAISSTTHTIYVSVETGFMPPSASQIFAVDTTTGQVSSGISVNTPIHSIATDGATLLAITDNPFGGIGEAIRIDPATGVTTAIGGLPTITNGYIAARPSVDPTTHTLFVDVSSFNGGIQQDTMFSINDQTGASTSAPLLSLDNLTSMVVEAPAPITPESIKADVQSALASGAIDNAGMANSLLAKLNAAADALARGASSGARNNGCATASNIYEAFIHEVTAQSTTSASGVRGHIAPSTGAQLISEAQLLIGNCSAPATSPTPPPASSPAGPKLFAVFNEAQVVALDPATGAHTTIADLTAPGPPGVTLGDLVSDARNHRLFTVQTTFSFDPFASSTYQLVTVSTQGGGFTVSPNLAQNVALAFDSSTGNLFGVTQCCPVQVVKIDPSTGAESLFATTNVFQFPSVAIAPARHTMYITSPSFATFPPSSTLTTVDTTSGAVNAGPNLAQGVLNLAYDSSAGALFGKSFCCPTNVLRIDPGTGAESIVDPTDLGFGNSLAVDPSSHKLYAMEDQLGAFAFNQFVATIGESGGVSLSTAIPLGGYIRSLVVEAVTITPQSIEDDVRSALASGAIDNSGVANSLLAKLDTAAEARAGSPASGARTNGCTTASNVYQAFINEVRAQSGTVASAARPHIAPSTGAQLITEAQFLIANCP